MTPEERRLIADLFDRMQSYGAPEKDREAEGLIRERVRSMHLQHWCKAVRYI